MLKLYIVLGVLAVAFVVVVFFWSRSKKTVSEPAEETPTLVCFSEKSGYLYLRRVSDGLFAYKNGSFGPYRVDFVYKGTSKKKHTAFAQEHKWKIVKTPIPLQTF